METVKIGGRTIPVVPQRHARLRRKLSMDDFQRIMSKDYSQEAYRVLGILIPELPNVIPEHEWDGFASRSDWEHWRETGEDNRSEEEADKEDDLSPTTAEVVNAFEKAFMVSGAGRMGKIVDLVLAGRNMSQGQVPTTSSQTPDSPGSLGASGAST